MIYGLSPVSFPLFPYHYCPHFDSQLLFNRFSLHAPNCDRRLLHDAVQHGRLGGLARNTEEVDDEVEASEIYPLAAM
jgi:hypothetical protein